MRLLKDMFCPTIPDIHANAVEGEDPNAATEREIAAAAKGAGLLEHVDLVCTVIVPECIIRLIARRQGRSLKDAERRMMSDMTDNWVAEIFTWRELHASGMSMLY
jgi:hypothetical protein